jgi:hypothetical protein
MGMTIKGNKVYEMPKSVSQQMAANVSYHIFYGTGD